jgi:hypothetical protein
VIIMMTDRVELRITKLLQMRECQISLSDSLFVQIFDNIYVNQSNLETVKFEIGELSL